MVSNLDGMVHLFLLAFPEFEWSRSYILLEELPEMGGIGKVQLIGDFGNAEFGVPDK
jgi:hypothetical protein